MGMARPKSIQQSVPGLWKVLRYFWPWIGKERPLIAVSMGALLTGVLLRLAEPWPLKFVPDRVIVTDRPADLNGPTGIDALPPMTLLTVCAGAVVAISSLRALADYHQRVGLAKIGNRVLRRIRNHVYLHVQSLSLSFHNAARSGDLIVRVTRDVSLLRDVVSTAALPLVASLITLVGMAVVMALLQWQLALAALATVPLFWFSTIRIGRGIHQAALKQRSRAGRFIAITGASGGGKSTLVSLLLRLYDPTEGRVLVDGKDETPTDRGLDGRATDGGPAGKDYNCSQIGTFRTPGAALYLWHTIVFDDSSRHRT
jgi:ATP-binding cassette subfamily B protein